MSVSLKEEGMVHPWVGQKLFIHPGDPTLGGPVSVAACATE